MSFSSILNLTVAPLLEDLSDQMDILAHSLKVQMIREQDVRTRQATTTVPPSNSLKEAMSINLKKRDELASLQTYKFLVEEKQTFSSLQSLEEKYRKTCKKADIQRKAELMVKEKEQSLLRQKQEIQKQRERLIELSHHAEQLKMEIVQKQSTKKEDMRTLLLPYTKRQEAYNRLKKEQELQLITKRMADEEKTHKMAMKFLEKQHQERLQMKQEWEQKTTQLKSEMEKQLADLEEKKNQSLDKLMKMRREFREMEQLVEEDMREQEKLCQQEAETRAAVKLQAWWRGCMVRKGLGPFRKAPKKMMKKKAKKNK